MSLFFFFFFFFSGHEQKLILSDYKLSTQPNETSINIKGCEFEDFTEEDVEKLISHPFRIIIDVFASYVNRT